MNSSSMALTTPSARQHPHRPVAAVARHGVAALEGSRYCCSRVGAVPP